MGRHALIVADAGPLIALASIQKVDLLPALYERIVVPRQVVLELERGKPRAAWDLASRVDWLEVVEDPPVNSTVAGLNLDAGETAAISWALAHPGAWLLLDDQAARKAAMRTLGLDVTGTIGLLVDARRAGLAPPLKSLFQELRARGLRYSDSLSTEALRLAGDP